MMQSVNKEINKFLNYIKLNPLCITIKNINIKSSKILFKLNEIKIFSDKQKSKTYVASSLVLQEMLKVLQRKGTSYKS